MKRRDFLKYSMSASAAGASASLFGGSVLFNRAQAAALGIGLADPAIQRMFTEKAINALATNFKYKARPGHIYNVGIQQAVHRTGLRNAAGIALTTKIWGYIDKNKHPKNHHVHPTWPGRTFEVHSNQPATVNWSNELKTRRRRPLPHLLPVDESLHWCYSLPGYEAVSIKTDGVPLVPHLHGGHNDHDVDGNPEYFTGTTTASRGPRWVSDRFVYDNSQKAGTLWYHDHALGITRLNVYAGLAGFYIIRDSMDTGRHSNPLHLPAKQYELAYCIQDRMFKDNGALFYPAFKGEPAWSDFISPEVNANLPIPGGPSALAEFFGDHIVVNGKLWPKTNVEPRNYRMRLLNGCDSRFMRLRFRTVAAGATDLTNASAPITFAVIGSDQGFLKTTAHVTEIDFLPGERLDVVVNFAKVPFGSRVIMENILGDTPFGGGLPAPEDLYPNRRTDRVMAFDVRRRKSHRVHDRFPGNIHAGNGFTGILPAPVKTRKLGLYEGTDQYGRLMPMLGTAEPTTDVLGNSVDGSMIWGAPITENPALDSTEIWEFYNATGDAHPIHVHLVNFEIISRNMFSFTPMEINVGSGGVGLRMENIILGKSQPVLASEKGPKDMVLCYPGEVTRIKMTFDKPGRYVWHCHILSHEDHEMMRPFHVGPVAAHLHTGYVPPKRHLHVGIQKSSIKGRARWGKWIHGHWMKRIRK